MTTRSTILLILNVLSTFIGLILGARAVIRLLDINQTALITQWIMNISNTLVLPFRGLLEDVYLGANSVIDVSTIIALIVYAIVFSLLYRLVARVTTTRVIETDPEYGTI